MELAPGCLAGPLHVHKHEDAISYVLSGRLTFQVGTAVTPVTAGDAVPLPRLVPHTFWNSGPEPARAVDVVTPGGLERFYDALARVAGAPDAMERVVQLEQRYGVVMDWDSIPELLTRYDLRMAGG